MFVQISALGVLAVLAYRPFIDPLDLQKSWLMLLVPLCFGIALTYKAVRVPNLRTLWRETAIFTTQLVLAVVLIGGLMFWIVQWLLPRVMPMPA
jgi:hypothetical protein